MPTNTTHSNEFSEKKTINQSSTAIKAIGVVMMLAGLLFFGASNAIFSSFPTDDAEFSRVALFIRLFQGLISLVIVVGGFFLFFVKKQMIYDDKTIEYRTTFLGRTTSKIVDRSLVRDLGMSALRPNSFDGFDHHHPT